MIKIAPSILSCDYSKIGSEVLRMQQCGADLLHIDIMDGHFVPNLSIGPAVVSCTREGSALPFDVHLMISEPLKYIDAFARAGADIITFHVEAESPIKETIDTIKKVGCTAGLVVKPSTPVETVFPYLNDIGMVLIMTVEPGFGGQKFMPEMLKKVLILRSECKKRGLSTDIEVDGGISEKTIADAAKAGANVFAVGSSIFNSDDAEKKIRELREIAQKSQ